MLEPEMLGRTRGARPGRWPMTAVARMRPLVAAFLLLAGPLLVLQAVLIPPGYAPDEGDHAVRAESLLHGAVLGMRGEAGGPYRVPGEFTGVWADGAIAEAARAIRPGEPKEMTRENLVRLQGIGWGSPGFVASSVAPYFPVFYLPQAAGMGLARLAGAPPLAAVYAGRLLGALGFVVLGALALAVAERGAALIFAALMLPMTLWLAASLNQDGLMIAAACLGAAMLTRAEARGGAARLWAAVCIALVVLAKLPYAPLAALLLLPVRGAGPGALFRRATLVVLTLLPAAGWSVLLLKHVSTGLPQPPYAPGPLYRGAVERFTGTDLAAQWRVLSEPVSRAVTLPLGSAIAQAPDKLRQMVGGLGLLDISLPGPLYAAWLLALAAALLAAPFGAAVQPAFAAGFGGMRPRADPLGRLLALLALIGCVEMIYVTLYLTWTQVGMDHVEGVQGRYFIPLLPFAALVMPRGGTQPLLGRLLALPAVGLAAAGLVFLPLWTVASLYFR